MKPARAVLFDRDGTLIYDAAPNADPRSVRLMRGARTAVRRLRAAGVRIGVVTNQPAIARREVAMEQLHRVHERIEILAGPFDGWFVCRHEAHERCDCRKPQPGLVIAAARAFGVPVEECVVIGDIGSDVAAARNAGAHSVLVPTPVTRREEIESAKHIAPTLAHAVERVLSGAYV